ncbi:MAG: cell wall-binding repeat-containing protein [Bacillota bacterium]|nr:cell wall-binding repeat-containing protein [Bacillota bacterium]
MKNSKKKLMAMLVFTSIIATQLLVPCTAFAANTITNTTTNTKTDTKTQKTTDRISGVNRYDTSVQIANKNWTTSDYAVLARGDDFADALSSGPLAKAYNAPVLLSQTGKLDQEVLDEIISLKVKTIFIAGGTGAISADIEAVLESKSISVKRFSGKDRFETSELIAAQIKIKIGKVNDVAIATGLNYPDALSIAPIASSKDAPIILTNGKEISDSAKKFITDNGVTNTYIIGGTGVISLDIENNVDKLTINGVNLKAVRLGGKDRYDTNAKIIDYFKDSIDFSKIYLAVGDGQTSTDGFPDALSGSALAGANNAAIVLAYKQLSSYLTDLLSKYLKTDSTIIAFGGVAVISDTVLTNADKQRDTKKITPELSKISLVDQNNTSIKGRINKDNITFEIPADSKTIIEGSAALNEDLASVTLKLDLNNTSTVWRNDNYLEIPIYNIKTTDDFLKIILDKAAIAGYGSSNGFSVDKIKTLLNGASITLVDNNGNKKVYTLAIFSAKSKQAYFNTGFALFSNTNAITINCSESNIRGLVYSNDNFNFSGSILHLVDKLSAVKNISAYGWIIDIKNKIQNSQNLNLPNYSNDILNDVKSGEYKVQQLSSNNDLQIKVPTLCNDAISSYCTNISVGKNLISQKSVTLNANNVKLGGDEKIVLCSLKGDITINASTLDANGLIYAPNGTVYINVSRCDLKGTIIAKEIKFQGSYFNVNK